MAKNKFVLTSSFVKVEPEPENDVTLVIEKAVMALEKPTIKSETPKLIRQEKLQTNIKLSKDTKHAFQVWCFKNGKTMSDVLEKMIVDILKDKKS